MSLRVLMLDTGAYTPYYDYSLCKALTEAGCEVRWVTAPFIYDQIPNRDGLNIHYSFSRVLNVVSPYQFVLNRWTVLRQSLKAIEYPLDWVLLLQELRRNPPEVLHVQWAVRPTLDAWFLDKVRRLGCRIVYTAHNVLPHDVRPGDHERYDRLYKLADSIVVPSRYNAGQLERLFQIPAAKIFHIPLGNLNDFQVQTLTQREAKERLELPIDSSIILFFGLIKPYKGIASLIKAFAAVQRHLPEAMLVVVGRPHSSFGPCSRLIRELGLTDTVRTTLRYVPHAEMAPWFKAADVVALPYLATSQSAVLMTAYTFGRPVVTTTVGGLPEAVDPEYSGLLVPPGDEAALADALISMLSDSSRLTKMGEYARSLAETRYSWRAIASATLDVYRTLV